MTTTQPTQALSRALGTIHRRWIATVERNLSPAAEPAADFWARWGAARFLIDQMASFYRLEASLFEQIATSIPATDAARLRQRLGEMERTRARVVALGRRRGTRVEVRREAKKLLVQIRGWSDDLEAATRDLEPTGVPAACGELLRDLRAAVDVAA